MSNTCVMSIFFQSDRLFTFFTVSFVQCFCLFLLVCLFFKEAHFFIIIINQLLHSFCFKKRVYGIPILQIRKVRPAQRGRMPSQTHARFSGRMAGPGFNPTTPKSSAPSSCRFKFQPNLENQRQCTR